MYSVYSVYSVYSSCIPVYSVYSVYSSCTPVYSRVFLLRRAPRGPLSPEAHYGAARGGRVGVHGTTGYRVVACPGVYPLGTPLDLPRRGTLEYPAPPPLPPRAAPEWASGLKRPRGVRVRVSYGHPSRVSFSYLRSFWPGSRIPLQGIRSNRWIGSRARAPWGALDVSDLECLRLRCGRAGSATKERIRRPDDAGSVSFVDGSGFSCN